MKLLLLFLSVSASAQVEVFHSANPTTVVNTNVSASTVTISQNGATANTFPNSPLKFACNINGICQLVGQNLSNGTNAVADLVLTSDLGGNTSYYIDVFVNSSRYSQTAYSAEPSSATGLASSDSDLFLWAGINGGLNGAANERIVFGSSNPVAGNIAGYILPATANGPGAWVVPSSVTITNGNGLKVSSMTIGAGISFSSSPVMHVGGGTLVGTLASGTTFMTFTPDAAITLIRISADVQVAGVGGSGDTVTCNNSVGTGIAVTLSAAAGAGTDATAIGRASIAYQQKVSCHIDSGATTRPITAVTLEYIGQ